MQYRRIGPKVGVQECYKRVFHIGIPENHNEKIPSLVKRFQGEQKRYRVIVAGVPGKDIVYSFFNYFFDDDKGDEEEEVRLREIAHNYIFLG